VLLQPVLSAEAAPKAAPKLQNVVDGGVTELVSSSVIGSLSSAEKKVETSGFRHECSLSFCQVYTVPLLPPNCCTFSPYAAGISHTVRQFKVTAQACLYLIPHPDSLPCVAQSLEINKRIQRQNNAPVDFPAFVRDGFDIKIMADDYERDNKGLIYKV